MALSRSNEVLRESGDVEILDLEKWEGPNRFAMVVHNVFSEEECQLLIDRSEENGYEKALVNVGGGRQANLIDVRNSDRTMIDDPGFAQEIWKRVKQKVNNDPNLMNPNWAVKSKSNQSQFRALGLNERLRFLRYDKGHYFVPHYDGTYYRRNEAGLHRVGERSLVTCQLYLNDNFEGGATRFVGRGVIGLDIVPKTGSVLLFEHALYHEGCLVTKGRKYVIRTDVMYTCKDGLDYEEEPICLIQPTSSQQQTSRNNKKKGSKINHKQAEAVPMSVESLVDEIKVAQLW